MTTDHLGEGSRARCRSAEPTPFGTRVILRCDLLRNEAEAALGNRVRLGDSPCGHGGCDHFRRHRISGLDAPFYCSGPRPPDRLHLEAESPGSASLATPIAKLARPTYMWRTRSLRPRQARATGCCQRTTPSSRRPDNRPQALSSLRPPRCSRPTRTGRRSCRLPETICTSASRTWTDHGASARGWSLPCPGYGLSLASGA